MRAIGCLWSGVMLLASPAQLQAEVRFEYPPSKTLD